jgi:hypothetical protein
VPLAGWGGAGSDGPHQSVANQNVAAIDNAIGKNDLPCENLIRHALLLSLQLFDYLCDRKQTREIYVAKSGTGGAIRTPSSC